MQFDMTDLGRRNANLVSSLAVGGHRRAAYDPPEAARKAMAVPSIHAVARPARPAARRDPPGVPGRMEPPDADTLP